MYALLSVSDKTNIDIFARELISLGYKILSTGGTLTYLKDKNIVVDDLSSYINYPQLFSGRVKTLHPKIFGGILFKRGNLDDETQAKDNNIDEINLVCVNLYPFKETTKKSDDFNLIIENIDIGGPSLIRAAAKNYTSVVVVTDPIDYAMVVDAIKNKSNTIEFRKDLMIKAFEYTANYDCFIANYMNDKFNDGFGANKFIFGKKYIDTKYGENPHQRAALYDFDNNFKDNFQILKGEPSFNNFLDLNIAFKIVKAFAKNALCIVKHGNPCGFAIKDDALSSYIHALKCDSLSAYGGVVALNGIIDSNLALKMNEMFFEAIIADAITNEAMEIFNSKKRLRLFTMSNIAGSNFDFKCINGGFLFQDRDYVLDNEVKNARQMGDIASSIDQMKDLEIAYKIVAFTKSNCVAYVRDSALVGIGMGLTSRVDSTKLAISKAKDMGLSLSNSSLASEAFFPFRDSIDLAASVGVKAIIQPGGSRRDDEVIQASNEHKIALYFSGRRHFLH